MGLTQGALTPNFTHMLNEQSNHIAYIIGKAMQAEAKTVEASAEAERKWVETIHRTAMNNAQFQMDCTPGYYNNEGQPRQGRGFITGQYGGGPVEFFRILEEWRKEGNLQGLDIR